MITLGIQRKNINLVRSRACRGSVLLRSSPETSLSNNNKVSLAKSKSTDRTRFSSKKNQRREADDSHDTVSGSKLVRVFSIARKNTSPSLL